MKIYTKTGDRGTTSLFGGERVDKNSARIKAYGEVDELNSLIGVIISDLSLRTERSNPLLRHSRPIRFLESESRNRRPDQESSKRELVSRKLEIGRAFLRIDSRFRWNDKKRSVDDKQLMEIHRKLLRVQEELFVLGADLATPLSVKVKIPRIGKSYITRLEKEIDNWSKTLPQLKNFILPGGGKVGSKLHLARTVARRAERSIVELSGQEKINPHAQIYINRLSDWFFILARYVNKLEGLRETAWMGRSKKSRRL